MYLENTVSQQYFALFKYLGQISSILNPNQFTSKKLVISLPGAFFGTFLLNGLPGAFFGTFNNQLCTD